MKLPSLFNRALKLIATFFSVFILFSILTPSPSAHQSGTFNRLHCCMNRENGTDICGRPSCVGRCATGIKAMSLDYVQENLDDDAGNRAFLLETSGRPHLNVRQACSLESLAFHNPNLTIYVMMTVDPKRKKNNSTSYLESILVKYKNVKREVIDLNAYLAETPLEKWYYCSNWTRGPHKTVHLSDGLRALTVWKYGGFYFDLDFIHIRPVSAYRNFIALEDTQQIGNSAFHAERKHPIFREVLEEFDRTYRADLWAHNGPGSFTRVLRRYCSRTDLLKLNYITCAGFNIFPYSSYYPLYHSHSYELFNMQPRYNVTQAAWINEVSLGVHVWNKITAGHAIRKNSSQLYVQLANVHCPLTVSMAPDVF